MNTTETGGRGQLLPKPREVKIQYKPSLTEYLVYWAGSALLFLCVILLIAAFWGFPPEEIFQMLVEYINTIL